jgi:hypothetical protein
MRQLSWALIGMTGLMAIGLQTAEAGSTCKILPRLCPAETNVHREDKATAVPEPATLILLGAGVSAVGAAALRRRKKK